MEKKATKNAPKKAAPKKAAPKTVAVPKKAAASEARKRVVFTLAADVGSEVYVAGDFNNWDSSGKKLVDKKNDGVYSAALTLAPGEYEYKFVINGTWCVDPNCAEWHQNSLGTLNSVLRV